MSVLSKNLLAKFVLIPATIVLFLSAPVQASDITDVARRFSLPVPVVETVLKNIDNYFASTDAPDNRMTSGLFKDLALKAVKAHMSHLDEEGPGKASESTAEEKNATYKVTLRTTRHESTETAECVDANAVANASEGVPTIKEGAFSFDSVHPKTSGYSWKMTFCRTPLNGGGDFTDWQLR
jgi:hypothetical protein